MSKLSIVDADVRLAMRLEDECPWHTCSKLWRHAGWLDLIETIKTVSPDAYQALKRDLLNRPDYFGIAKLIVRSHIQETGDL